MKRILVTGSTGFVGKQVLKSLMNEDVEITLVVRGTSSRNVPESTAIKKVVFTEDLFRESAGWWEHVCQDIDIVVHAAWYAEHGKYLHSLENLQCLTGSLSLATGAANAGVSRFIGVGTCFEYAVSDSQLHVNSPLGPTNIYSATKVALFLTLREFFATKNIQFAWCRLFYLFGENEHPDRLAAYVLNQLSESKPVLLTDGLQIRDYMDVQEAGKKIGQVALGDQTGPQNVCTGVGVSVRTFVTGLAEPTRRGHLLHFGVVERQVSEPPIVYGLPTV